jgi:hypothetical protein
MGERNSKLKGEREREENKESEEKGERDRERGRQIE